MRISIRAFAAVLAAALALPVQAAEHIVTQKNKGFSFKHLIVRVGDSVKFVNEDPFNHNIFSLSDVKSFDLGSFGNGLWKAVLMDKPGLIEVECAVHPDMKLNVEVRK